MRAEDAASCIADRGIDPDPTQPCPKHRAEGSRFCDKHADYPNYFVTVQIWVTDRQQRDLPFDEEELMAHILAEYPKASYQQPKCYDFQKYAASCARTQSPSEEDVLLGKRYMEAGERRTSFANDASQSAQLTANIWYDVRLSAQMRCNALVRD